MKRDLQKLCHMPIFVINNYPDEERLAKIMSHAYIRRPHVLKRDLQKLCHMPIFVDPMYST